jgi:hypothetical protein
LLEKKNLLEFLLLVLLLVKAPAQSSHLSLVIPTTGDLLVFIMTPQYSLVLLLMVPHAIGEVLRVVLTVILGVVLREAIMADTESMLIEWQTNVNEWKENSSSLRRSKLLSTPNLLQSSLILSERES